MTSRTYPISGHGSGAQGVLAFNFTEMGEIENEKRGDGESFTCPKTLELPLGTLVRTMSPTPAWQVPARPAKISFNTN